jgi:hypothetical protein
MLGQCSAILSQVSRPDNTLADLRFDLSFQFDPERADSSVRAGAQEILQVALTTLAFRAQLICDQPIPCVEDPSIVDARRLHDFRLLNGRDATMTSASGRGTASAPGRPGKKLTSDAAGLQAHFLGALEKPDQPLLRAFRSALEASDPSAEFMLQYAILGMIHGDAQGNIDSNIDPEGKMVRTPIPAKAPKLKNTSARKKVDGETPFTRVRNELAHNKDRGTPLNVVAASTAALVSELRALVIDQIKNELELANDDGDGAEE